MKQKVSKIFTFSIHILEYVIAALSLLVLVFLIGRLSGKPTLILTLEVSLPFLITDWSYPEGLETSHKYSSICDLRLPWWLSQ